MLWFRLVTPGVRQPLLLQLVQMPPRPTAMLLVIQH